jgi:hypothetical protein
MLKHVITTGEGVDVHIEYKKVENSRVVINGVVQPTTYSNKLVVTVQDTEVTVEAAFGGYCDDLWLDVELNSEEGKKYLSTEGLDY